MNTLRKLKNNSKALSPVVASIILIAVTVAVSVVVAAWMGGMTTGLMGNSEQATLTNIAFNPATVDDTNGTITVTISNTGNAAITINNAYVNSVGVDPTATDPVLPQDVAKLSSVDIILPNGWTSGVEYTIKATTAKGNNLVLSAFAP
jgi:flagellin-like protein